MSESLFFIRLFYFKIGIFYIYFTLFCFEVSLTNTEFKCGFQRIRSPRIIGGDDAYRGEFPWVVSIIRNGQHHCGGVLLNNRWIITAAHCIKDTDYPYNYQVKLGALSIRAEENSSVVVCVDTTILHPNFSIPQPYANDIALMRMARPIDFNDYILPMCLPTKNESGEGFHENLKGIVVGWGWIKDDPNATTPADILQKVKLPIIPDRQCQLWYRSRGKHLILTESQFCAGYKRGVKDACQGDSGGPFLVRNLTTDTFTLIGVVSAGIGCALPDLPGLYTRIDLFIPWIEQYIKK